MSHTELGQFISRDPVLYVDGLSLYRAYFVLHGLDPFGFEASDEQSAAHPYPLPAGGMAADDWFKWWSKYLSEDVSDEHVGDFAKKLRQGCFGVAQITAGYTDNIEFLKSLECYWSWKKLLTQLPAFKKKCCDDNNKNAYGANVKMRQVLIQFMSNSYDLVAWQRGKLKRIRINKAVFGPEPVSIHSKEHWHYVNLGWVARDTDFLGRPIPTRFDCITGAFDVQVGSFGHWVGATQGGEFMRVKSWRSGKKMRKWIDDNSDVYDLQLYCLTCDKAWNNGAGKRTAD